MIAMTRMPPCQRFACMRRARIKVAAADGEAVYHVMTRTVNGEFLIDDVGKEVLRKQLWQVADYCGAVTDWGELATLRGLRRDPVG